MGNLSNKQKKVLDEIIKGGIFTDAVTYIHDEYSDIEDELMDAMNCVYMRNHLDEEHIITAAKIISSAVTANLDLDEVCDNFSAEEMSEYLFEKHGYATYPPAEMESCDAEVLGLTLRNRGEDFLREALYAYTGMGHFVPVQEMIDELKKQLA